jgi:hypothetical protein
MAFTVDISEAHFPVQKSPQFWAGMNSYSKGITTLSCGEKFRAFGKYWPSFLYPYNNF